MIRRSTASCPNCNAGFWVEAGILANDHRYKCATCGAMIDIRMRWGKIVSVSVLPSFSESAKGCRRVSEPIHTNEEKRVGNVKYWKEHYGDKWLQAHDAWVREWDEWWGAFVGSA